MTRLYIHIPNMFLLNSIILFSITLNSCFVKLRALYLRCGLVRILLPRRGTSERGREHASLRRNYVRRKKLIHICLELFV
jgi:hypothetical protein